MTLIEQGRYPDHDPTRPPPARRGAPQSQCLHMLMGAGAEAFDRIVPGWRADLTARGAHPFDALDDSWMRLPGGWLAQQRSGLMMYACSRALIETMLRDRLSGCANVRLRSDCRVRGLGMDPARDRVCAVVTEDAVIAADLVVDAAGTASRLSHWLSAARGRGVAPRDMVVPSPFAYVSQWLRLPPEADPGWSAMSIAPLPGQAARAGMILRAENGFWNAVMLAGAGQAIPMTDRSLQVFAQGLAEGTLGAVIARAEPAGPVRSYGRIASRLRHWDQVPDWPGGLVVLGDAAMGLDPYFGLGMTTAARGVTLLVDQLGQPGFDAAGFQRALARQNADAWRLVTGRDPDGTRRYDLSASLLTQYRSALTRPGVARALFECHHLLKPIDAL
ncbi:MAG: hypothetical protein OIF47_09040 [Marinibacterium sp.]|nr:hypothetical protein [Marinibacterium sp.]